MAPTRRQHELQIIQIRDLVYLPCLVDLGHQAVNYLEVVWDTSCSCKRVNTGDPDQVNIPIFPRRLRRRRAPLPSLRLAVYFRRF